MSINKYFQKKLALGCDATLVIVSRKSQQYVDDIFNMLWLNIFQFERQFSRFIPASELSMFNNSAGLEVPVSKDFKELLLTAKNMSRLTEGLYNPFILPALQKAGYVQSFISTYSQDISPNYSRRLTKPALELKVFDDTAMIPLNSAIDMGGIGKGYLADKLAGLIIEYDIEGYWFSLGGDVVTHGYDKDGQPWHVAVQNAVHPKEVLDIEIATDSNRLSVASSGIIVRKGEMNSQPWHHIIDPRTAKPAQTDVLLATVVAENTCLADVLAKCAIIVGSKEAPNLLKYQGVSSYILQTQQKDGVTVIAKGEAISSNKITRQGALV